MENVNKNQLKEASDFMLKALDLLDQMTQLAEKSEMDLTVCRKRGILITSKDNEFSLSGKAIMDFYEKMD